MKTISKYQPREMHFHQIWDIDGLQMKVYLITVNADDVVPPELLANAKTYVEAALPDAHESEGYDHGAGYIILHLGKMENWLLIHWWAHNDIVLRLLASSAMHDTTFRSRDHTRFHACVWEHVVINHERNAWVNNMMTDPGDAHAYLNDRLPRGMY